MVVYYSTAGCGVGAAYRGGVYLGDPLAGAPRLGLVLDLLYLDLVDLEAGLLDVDLAEVRDGRIEVLELVGLLLSSAQELVQPRLAEETSITILARTRGKTFMLENFN